jgi:hypothetical protein
MDSMNGRLQAQPHTRVRGGEPRARSLPFPRHFIVAALLSAIHYLAILGWLTCVVIFLLNSTELACWMVIGFLITVIITWILALLKRRSARCPLCKGTPLLNSGALPHGKAFRIPPLNHGVTATLSLICTQEYRCMYCGNLYDLLKPSSPTKRASGAKE